MRAVLHKIIIYIIYIIYIATVEHKKLFVISYIVMTGSLALGLCVLIAGFQKQLVGSLCKIKDFIA